MILEIINFTQNTLIPLGAFGVFLAGFIQEIIPIFSSAVVMIFTGFFFLEGDLSFELIKKLIFVVVIPMSMGLTLGSLFIFYLAFIFGQPIIERWGKWFGLRWSHIEKIKEKSRGTYIDEIIIIIARATPFVSATAIAAYCGIIKMRVWKYLLLTFLGTIPRVFFLAILGWQVGNLYYIYASTIEKIGIVILLMAILSFSVYRFYVLRRKKRL